MYKTAVIIYIVCFFCYSLFSRVPDYFDGETVQGVVSQASFSKKENHPTLVVNYRVGAETFYYKTDMWFLKNYKKGQIVPIIYNPSNPSKASIYAFIGYWIHWPELLFTFLFFIILFFASIAITGKNNLSPLSADESRKKRKYNDD